VMIVRFIAIIILHRYLTGARHWSRDVFTFIIARSTFLPLKIIGHRLAYPAIINYPTVRFHRSVRRERREKSRASYVSYANFVDIRRRPRPRNHASERASRAGQLFGAKCKRLYRLLIHPFVSDRCANDSGQLRHYISRRRFVKNTLRNAPTDRLVSHRRT